MWLSTTTFLSVRFMCSPAAEGVGIAMTHSWKIIGGAFLLVAYLISAYQIVRSLIRPRLGENLRWFLPRAFLLLLSFCVFMYWIVEGEWLKFKDLRNHSVQNPSTYWLPSPAMEPAR
jgi:hypothetical protein